MNGVELRAKRLFNADTGRSYIVAIDHGLSGLRRKSVGG
jgi:DhnA family fructose-bisphosphate aldolase class Ia